MVVRRSAAKQIQPEEVPLPPVRAVDGESFVQQIAKLQIGEVAARATRFDGETTAWSEIVEEKAKQGRTLSTQVARAKAKRDVTNPVYTTTIGDMRSAEGDIFVVVTVTRLQ